MAASSNGPHPAIKKRILVFCDYYLPSTKGGGGTWTLVNLIERFCDRYDFYVVARNHQSRTDRAPFLDVKSNAWNDIGNASVYYLSPEQIKKSTVESLVRAVSPQAVFLNSVFSKPVVTFLRFRNTRRTFNTPVILAPCGELSQGALSLKPWKKRVFLMFAKTSGLYRNIHWKATSAFESADIRRVFGEQIVPFVAPDLPPKQIAPDFSAIDKPRKEPGTAKFVFYSRIAPIKNLLFVLETLSKAVSFESVELTIIGPIEDQIYWKKCVALADHLPRSIIMNKIDAVSQERGLEMLFSNHFFILPTLGENFGYAILESLAEGCPVIISDQTLWLEVSERKAGWTIPLDDLDKWIEIICQCINMNQGEFLSMSTNARQIAMDWLRSPELELATKKLLTEAIGV